MIRTGLKAIFCIKPVVNFTNILWAQLRQYSCAKKVQTKNVSTKKTLCKTFVQKKPCMKYWWNWHLEQTYLSLNIFRSCLNVTLMAVTHQIVLNTNLAFFKTFTGPILGLIYSQTRVQRPHSVLPRDPKSSRWWQMVVVQRSFM